MKVVEGKMALFQTDLRQIRLIEFVELRGKFGQIQVQLGSFDATLHLKNELAHN
jgi:hypothetical protein